MAGKQNFVILPKEGLFEPPPHTFGARLAAMARSLVQKVRPMTSIRMEGRNHPVKLLDAAGENGAKLVEMDADAGADLVRRQAKGDFRIFENKIYRTMSVTADDLRPKHPLTPPPAASTPAAATTAATPATPIPGLIQVPFTITDAKTGKPVEGASVMLFADYAASKGSPPGTTDANGQCSVAWLKTMTTIPQVLVMAPEDAPTNWGYFTAAVPLQASFALALETVDPPYPDCARFYYPAPAFDPASGVTVGVIDTGVTAQPALNLVGGINTVAGEDPTDYASNGDPHGTHVAGLVGAKGPMQGNAPGVALRSYRVFGTGGGGATSFAIIKAVVAGVADGCDVLNMSLGVDGEDPPLQEAIKHADAHGVLVVAAGNNNNGGPVGSPACYPETIGVSAIGEAGCMPANSQPQAHVTTTRGTDPNCFLADFSCVGPQLKLVGPGVGVVSTLPGNQYGQLSGTSMASPLVAGFAASLLAKSPKILSAKRDGARTTALGKALLAAAKPLGLTPDQEGRGLPAVPPAKGSG